MQVPAPATPPGQPQLAYAAWARRLARVTGIPARALEAYANAHAVMAASRPSCHLTWVSLAGIAAVESQHGTIGGRTLLPDGRPSSPIIGVALDGANNNRAIAATDGGLLTGDKVWEHAVGPFQFIPSAWAIWRADARGDGRTDPQNIDNAALAAAKYLCADNRNLASGEDWLRQSCPTTIRWTTPKPVDGRVVHPGNLAAQHGVLVPQHQQLGVLAQVSPHQHRGQTEQPTHEPIRDRQQ